MPRVCSICRARLAEGELFCGNCGAPAFCPACGHRIAKGELYCGECGRKAGPDTAEVPPPPVVSKAPAVSSMQTSPPPLPPEPRRSPPDSANRWRPALLMLAMLGILVGGGIVWWAHRSSGPEAKPTAPMGEPAAGLIPARPAGTNEGISPATPGQYTPPAPALGPTPSSAGPLHADPRELGIVFDELRQGQPGPAPGQEPPPGNSRITRVVLTRNTSDAAGRKGIIFAVSFVSDPLGGGGGHVVVHFRDANGGVTLSGQAPYADANGNMATWVPYVSPRMSSLMEGVPVFMPYDQLPAVRAIEAQVALYNPATRQFITNPVSFPLDPLH